MGENLDQRHHKISNWTELLKWYRSLEEAVEDETSWKCRQGLFDDIKIDAVSKKFKIYYGMQHVCKNKKIVKNVLCILPHECFKRACKTIGKKITGKGLIVQLKKTEHLKRTTTMKMQCSNGKKGVSHAETFVHFKDDAASHKHHNFVPANGCNETCEVHVKVFKSSDKQTPKLLTELEII